MSSVAASRARTRRRQKQLEFLLTIDEPVLGPIYKDDTGLSLTGITMTILNHGRTTSRDDDGNTSLYSIITFMRDIQQYLPYDLRKSDYRCGDLWSRKQSVDSFGDNIQNLMRQVADWYDAMKKAIMNILSSEYYCEGKMQYIELLKRRYKEQYSEKVEQEVTADVKSDNTINICIEDA